MPVERSCVWGRLTWQNDRPPPSPKSSARSQGPGMTTEVAKPHPSRPKATRQNLPTSKGAHPRWKAAQGRPKADPHCQPPRANTQTAHSAKAKGPHARGRKEQKTSMAVLLHAGCQGDSRWPSHLARNPSKTAPRHHGNDQALNSRARRQWGPGQEA